MPSIRRFLLINLLLAITLTTYVTLVGNYYIDQREIQKHLDFLMSQYAYSLQALLNDEDLETHHQEIQQQLDAVPKFTKNSFDQGNYQLIIWDKNQKVLLHTAHAPALSLQSFYPGLVDAYREGETWRVFTLPAKKSGRYNISVIENYNIRNDLAQRITRDDIYVMLITYPLCGLLIWIIIGRGLSILRKVESEVADRAPSHLEPVSIEYVPVEIKPLIDELNRLFFRLQLAIDREKRFSADAAHELRTPLAALKTQTQIAMRVTDPAELKQILTNVIVGVDRCTHVIQQLLTLSKLAPEADTINDSIHVNLVKLTAEVVAQLAPFAVDKNVEIFLESEKENISVMGNVTALSILVRNLVDNAIRYTPSGGVVKVAIDVTIKNVILRVIDNGPGIPPELHERVFERFFRVLGTKASGSGLGLSIVQQIARLHNATLELGSPEAGTGLEIRVLFPMTYS